MVSSIHRLLLREGRNNPSNSDFQTCLRGLDIERGVRQGYVMSQDLFNYYSKLILRELEKRGGGSKNWRTKHYNYALCR